MLAKYSGKNDPFGPYAYDYDVLRREKALWDRAVPNNGTVGQPPESQYAHESGVHYHDLGQALPYGSVYRKKGSPYTSLGQLNWRELFKPQWLLWGGAAVGIAWAFGWFGGRKSNPGAAWHIKEARQMSKFKRKYGKGRRAYQKDAKAYFSGQKSAHMFSARSAKSLRMK